MLRIILRSLGCGVLLAGGVVWGQDAAQAPPAPGPVPTVRARTNLVLVPTLVETKKGEPIFALKADDFVVEDNGVPQAIRLDEDTDTQAISLVVLVENGRDAAAQFERMRGLGTMLDAIPGEAKHETAVVAFDSQPRPVSDFSPDSQQVEQALRQIQPGDGGAAIRDAVAYAVDLLADRPKGNLRAILLISETRDHGSKVPIEEVIRKVTASNTIVYSVTFAPAKTEVLSELKHGGGGGLMEPILFAIAAMKKNTAAAIPAMTGGEYVRFDSGRDFDRRLGELANHIHNRYVLSFQPKDATAGLHRLTVRLKEDRNAVVVARSSYWGTAQ